MKNLILIVATIISISSCKKENISPENPSPENQLVGIWKVSHRKSVTHYLNNQYPDNIIELFDCEWYIKFSDKDVHDRLVRTSYTRDPSTGELEQFSEYVKINGNILIRDSTIGIGDTLEYKVSGNSLILKNCFKSETCVFTTEITCIKVSSVPSSTSGGTDGCPTVQCSATAQSTGVRCKNRTTNCNGKCYQHQ